MDSGIYGEFISDGSSNSSDYQSLTSTNSTTQADMTVTVLGKVRNNCIFDMSVGRKFELQSNRNANVLLMTGS